MHAVSHESAAFITAQFSKLLEVPKSSLVHRVTADREVCGRWKRHVKETKKSDVLYAASLLLGDVACELKEKGRMQEAPEWEQWAEEVAKMAGVAEDEEKWVWRSGG
jgi:hypothetical protein